MMSKPETERVKSERLSALRPMETRVATAAGDDVDVLDVVLNIARRLRVNLNRLLERFELNDVRFAVLEIVEQAAPDSCTQSELAEKLGQADSSISTLVERMRADGMLFRLQSRSDRRKRVLVQAGRGREMLVRARLARNALLEDVLECFSVPQREQLAGLLERLLSVVSEQRIPFVELPTSEASSSSDEASKNDQLKTSDPHTSQQHNPAA